MRRKRKGADFGGCQVKTRVGGVGGEAWKRMPSKKVHAERGKKWRIA